MLPLLLALFSLIQCIRSDDTITRLYADRNPKHTDLVTANIRKATIEYVLDKEYATKKYGPIEMWDTSRVTDMSFLFFYGRCPVNSLKALCAQRIQNFNEDLSNWDVSSVTSFESMFFNALKFNADIRRWNTSSAEKISRMFFGAREFNAAIAGWDVSSVTESDMMLKGAVNYIHDLSSWPIANLN
mmetsp:Transcript_50888/g.59457  ORF Transcript_50888/g.59457 Transcript_50888/m.59457 type:complete len:186 (-) Transcript_50888:158-715(-)